MTRRLRWLGVVVSVLVVLWFGFFFMNGSPAAPFAFDLEAVRALAAAPGEMLPQSVGVERVASGGLPRFFVVSGNGPFGSYPAVYASFQLRYADGRSIIIDTAYDRAGNASTARSASSTTRPSPG